MKPLEGELSVGEIVDCVVEQVVPYGAFVRINKTGRKGMIHISELAFNYVKNINDVISVQDKIKAKVIKIDERGRVDLSLKQASEHHKETSENNTRNNNHNNNFENRNKFNNNRNNFNKNNYENREQRTNVQTSVPNFNQEHTEPDSFEKKMASFMKISEAKLTDLNARNSARSGHGKRSNSNSSKNNNKF